MNVKAREFAAKKVHGYLNTRPFPKEIEEVLFWQHREHRLILLTSMIESESDTMGEILEMYQEIVVMVEDGWSWPNAD